MNTGDRTVQGTERGRISVVELELMPGTTLLAEYLHAGSHASSVVALHDRDRDLDDMRTVAATLHQAGFNVVNLDLPGHGLSGGDYDRDAVRAIAAAALFADPNRDRGVSFVAEGETCNPLLRSDIWQPVAAALLRPRSIPAEPGEPGVWQRTPGLYVVDPTDAASDAAADELARRARTWNLRCFVHRDVPAPGSGSVWDQQMTTVVRSFLLEQRTYRASKVTDMREGA